MEDKYTKAKNAAIIWHEKYENALVQISNLENEVVRWKKFSEELPDPEQLKQYKREIRILTKELHEQHEKYKDKISILERDKIIFQGRIQQLEEAQKDLKERYNELKQDYREVFKRCVT